MLFYQSKKDLEKLILEVNKLFTQAVSETVDILAFQNVWGSHNMSGISVARKSIRSTLVIRNEDGQNGRSGKDQPY